MFLSDRTVCKVTTLGRRLRSRTRDRVTAEELEDSEEDEDEDESDVFILAHRVIARSTTAASAPNFPRPAIESDKEDLADTPSSRLSGRVGDGVRPL
jgi:hypothetical protein